MSWKETCPMTERQRFMAEVEKRERSFSELCRAYGISRKTGYKWRERFERGDQELADRSHARLHQEHAVDGETVERLVSVRLRHPHWGARKLLAWLEQRDPELALPAASTTTQILSRHGLVEPRIRRRHAAGGPHFVLVEPYAPNVVWSADFKGHFRTADGFYCYPLTVTDNHSRYLLTCRGLKAPTTVGSRPWFERAFRKYGLPLVIRSDNGSPFASTGLAGLSKLSVWWIKLGIRPELIMPGQPQQNGRHERMHRTLKQEATRPPGADLKRQQRLFDAFVREYNQERPHEALQQRPPATAYVASPRTYQRRPPPVEYSGSHEVRYVRTNGEIKFLGYHVYLSEALVGEPVGLLRIDEQRWRVDFSFMPIGHLDTRTMRIASTGPSSKRGGAAPPAPPAV